MRRVLFAIGVVGLFGALAPSALGAVTVGQTFTPDVAFGGAGTWIQWGSPGNTYTVPANGVITSWSFQAPAGITPPMKLKVVRSAGGSDYTTVGDSQAETPLPSRLDTWVARITVNKGDLIGHGYSDTTMGARDGAAFNTVEVCCDDPVLDPPPGTTATYRVDLGNYQIDVAAVLEPDADHDGFGDETQDLCSTDGSTQGSCPVGPVTSGKKKCKRHKKKHSASSAKKKKCKHKKRHH